ncbi:MAG: sulfatase-like hydrolase/transferase [Myxococcota bacterium]
MRMRLAGLLIVGLVVGIGWSQREAILMRLPGVVGRIVNPIGESEPVVWQPGPARAERRDGSPNIVLIVADDLGFADLTFAGAGVADGAVPTPNIDSLARDGIQFGQGYTGNATCSPSRAAILTGRYPTRYGFEFTPVGKSFSRALAWIRRDDPRPPHYFAERADEVPPLADQGVPPGEITLAELLRARGYRTLGLGKWHLGEAERFQPTAQGFDEFLGFLGGASMFLEPDDPRVVNSKQDFDPIDRFLWANLAFGVSKDGGPRFRPDAYMTDYLAREAANAILANKNRPFFLYLAFNAPHTPLQALKSDYDALVRIADPRLRTYAAMIRALDRGVGTVLEALRANGLEENTLVLFTSDNGAPDYVGLEGLNRPWRGWKMTFFEGGIRTPFFAKWPARIAAGSRFDAPVAHVDLFATAAAAAGAKLPGDRVIDGVDLLAYARGERTGPPHDALFWRSGHYRALRAGDWKLQVSVRPQKTWLFDLASDPTERHDLAGARPDEVARLKQRLAALESEMAEPIWPALVEGTVAIDHTLAEPLEPDDEYVYWAN